MNWTVIGQNFNQFIDQIRQVVFKKPKVTMRVFNKHF
jgi:hypothetical protein